MITFLPLFFLACEQEAQEQQEIIPLAARQLLIRLSVDLRSIHPTEEELQAIESNPDLYDDFVDRYLEDSRLTERVRQIFNTRYLMRTGNTFGNDGSGYSDQQVAAASRTHRIHHGYDPAAIRSGQAASCTPVSVSPE